LNQEAIAVVEGYFAYLMKNHYRDRIMALEHHWNKCISLKGDHVEKKKEVSFSATHRNIGNMDMF
jgi:hypothetical protein